MSYNNLSITDRQFLAIELTDILSNAGFSKLPREFGRYAIKEDVFKRTVNLNIGESPIPGKMQVRVYTSIENGACRSGGKDSIKVSAIYINENGKVRGIGKAKRVHRTGKMDDICDRVLGRMRDVYKIALHADRCADCGAPQFKSKKGNMVCAEICFTKPEMKAKKAAARQAQQAQAVANGAPHPHPWLQPVDGVPW